MTFDIAGATIQTNANALSITTNSNVGLYFNALNIPQLGNRPYFIATKNLANWVNYTAANWIDLSMDYAIVNNGSYYSTSTYAFTAPVTGTYWFTQSCYSYKNTATNNDSYTHPIFRVNGSYSARMASASTNFRLRNRTYYAGGYVGDTQNNQIIYLTAGDYVTAHTYSSTAQMQWYGNESIFCGCLLG